MKDKYEKIQKYLFSMIPERWEEIYLYASINQKIKGKKTGELYFYYVPKGILKKKPVNVYEIPQKFNINEDEYLKLVNELYNCIKDLSKDFINTDQELWNSLTISINNNKFKIEYDYSKLPTSEQRNNEKRIIWRYEYLGIGGEKKEERKVLEEYFSTRQLKRKTEIYETGLYLKTANNAVSFEKDKEKNKDIPKFQKENEAEQQKINPGYQKAKEVRGKSKQVYQNTVQNKKTSQKDNVQNKQEEQNNKNSKKNQILNM